MFLRCPISSGISLGHLQDIVRSVHGFELGDQDFRDVMSLVGLIHRFVHRGTEELFFDRMDLQFGKPPVLRASF